MKFEHLALIGSGPTAIFVLRHFLESVHPLKPRIGAIAIFDKSDLTGMGMPYTPRTTDRYNLSNISSGEIPPLPVSLADWLRAQDGAVLRELDLEGVEITSDGIYSRLALGRYLRSQYHTLVRLLRESGIQVTEHPGCEVTDLEDDPEARQVRLTTRKGERYSFERVVIATGHVWPAEDRPGEGYYASPWPIFKLLPGAGEYYNFPVGTLGASLSAFDVLSSLAHRHGTFTGGAGGKTYHPFPGTEEFKVVLHSANGLLPHLQFDQVEPFREIYRHTSRRAILNMLDSGGFLRLGTYFDRVCRPALIQAFKKDGMRDVADLLGDPGFGLARFVARMTEAHDYGNAFKGMRGEMAEARESVRGHRPIHWKETVDDLMYTLNFHAEFLPAEDHLLLKSLFMPFLMNVIAALPLASAETILALYEAGKVEMVSGTVRVSRDPEIPGMTTISVEEDGVVSTRHYRLFIECGGQKPLELEDYPFPGLVAGGRVRKARAAFREGAASAASVPGEKHQAVFQEEGQWYYQTGGVDIDGAFRLWGRDGNPSPRVHDLAFPHVSGVRPYSYGLQACGDTAAILVRAWVEEVETGVPADNGAPGITRLYECR